MRNWLMSLLVVVALSGLSGCGRKAHGDVGPVPAAMADWSVYRSDKLGFAMLVPPNSSWADRDYGNGWGAVGVERHSVPGGPEFDGNGGTGLKLSVQPRA